MQENIVKPGSNKLSSILDKLIIRIGKAVSWANLLLIVVALLQVLLRYGFNHGLVILEELEWHLYSFAYMIGLSYAVVTDSHVRVDVLQSKFSIKAREWIELLGHLFLLLPFILVLIYYGVEFTHSSFILNEHSNAPLGLPFRWIIKAVIPISFILLLIAVVSRMVKSLLIILGRE